MLSLRSHRSFPLPAEPSWPDAAWFTFEVVIAAGACAVSFFVLRRWLLSLLRRTAGRTSFAWDDNLIASGAVWWLSLVLPGAVAIVALDRIDIDPSLRLWLQRVVGAGMVFAAMRAVACTVAAGYETWRSLPAWRHRPIKGYAQVVQIFVWTVGLLLTITTLVGADPLNLLAGVGALTAVLLLIFKDTILSLVASIQLTSNDMIRVGDWVSIPQAQTDGDVVDVALHTVKVQNWDKTISTIPTHKLIVESFRNWRGMQEAGGRRAKRSIRIDMESVRFLDREDLDVLAETQPELADWIAEQTPRLRASGDDEDGKRALPTNAGAFRAHAQAFLQSHPGVHPAMTLLVRALEPDTRGLPVEFYFFTRTTAWAEYERIQGEIVDHLLASLPRFDLLPYQEPAGDDVRRLAGTAAGAGEPANEGPRTGGREPGASPS